MHFVFSFWDCVKAKKRVFVTIPDRGNQFLHWLVTAWVQNQPLCSNLDLTVLSFLPLSKVLNSIWLIGSHQLEKFNSLMTARPLDQFMDPSTHCIYCLTQTVTFQVGWQSTFEDEVGAWEAGNGALGSAPAPGYGRGAGGDHHHHHQQHHHHHHHHQHHHHIDLISLYVTILWMRWRWKRQLRVWTATNTPTTTTRTTTRTIITNRSTTSNKKFVNTFLCRMRRTLRMCTTHHTATCTTCRATRTSPVPPTCRSRCSRPSLVTASQALQRPATLVSSTSPPSTMQPNALQAGCLI